MAERCEDEATLALVRAIDMADRVNEWSGYIWVCVRKAVSRTIRRWYKRKRPKVESLTSPDGSTIETCSPVYDPGAGELPFGVQDLFPPDIAETVRLVCVEGRTQREAAKLLGITGGTVSRRLGVAGKLLQGAKRAVQSR
ncbi:MAG: hypothetical protein LC104_06690 [Bacteroidales bacterium]|nr:hypothetical protein [Bacteroidales bacterium]